MQIKTKSEKKLRKIRVCAPKPSNQSLLPRIQVWRSCCWSLRRLKRLGKPYLWLRNKQKLSLHVCAKFARQRGACHQFFKAFFSVFASLLTPALVRRRRLAYRLHLLIVALVALSSLCPLHCFAFANRRFYVVAVDFLTCFAIVICIVCDSALRILHFDCAHLHFECKCV